MCTQAIASVNERSRASGQWLTRGQTLAYLEAKPRKEHSMPTIALNVPRASEPMTASDRRVIMASSIGTVFEWYDFYLFGVMAPIIATNFFTALSPATRDIFTLLAFAAGFAVRPFGALV